MYAIDFKYDGKYLSDWGLMICSFDGGSGVEQVSSGADITFTQIKATNSKKYNIYSSKYESPMSATFQVTRKFCETNDELRLEPWFISKVQRWLCRPDYHRFELVDQDGYENVYWLGTFSSKAIQIGGETIGLELTLYTNAPFAYMNKNTISFDCIAGNERLLHDNSDEIGYVYPKVTITMHDTGDFELTNSLDPRVTKIKNCVDGEKIILDGESLTIIFADDSLHKPSDFNFYFPRIMNTFKDNRNYFTTNLDCHLQFEYKPILKVGL